MTYIGAIDLSIEEIALLREITLDADPRDQNAMESNQSVVPKLMNLLLSRSAIPPPRPLNSLELPTSGQRPLQ